MMCMTDNHGTTYADIDMTTEQEITVQPEVLVDPTTAAYEDDAGSLMPLFALILHNKGRKKSKSNPPGESNVKTNLTGKITSITYLICS